MSFLPVKETLCYIYIYVCSTNIHLFVYSISLCDAQIKNISLSICSFIFFDHNNTSPGQVPVTQGEGGEIIPGMPGCHSTIAPCSTNTAAPHQV